MAQDNQTWPAQAWQPATQPQMPSPQTAGGPGGPGGYPPQPPQQQPQQPKRRGWIVALVAVVLIFVVLLVGVVSCSSVIGESLDLSADDSAMSGIDYLQGDAVAVITLDGDIAYDGTVCSPEGLKEQLDAVADSSHIKALVLRVDSGGGTAAAGEEMTEYLKEFKEETGIPVVVSSASTNASAAYEISSQADYIFTTKSCSIGAIGTALQITDLSGLYDLLGINVQNITSADSKDSTYGTRALTDEELEYYQNMVDEINQGFIENVAEGRGMTIEEVEELATGLTCSGVAAVENGLADEIGTLEDAIAYAAELAGLAEGEYETVDMEQSSADLSSLLDLLSESDISADELAAALEELESDGSITQ